MKRPSPSMIVAFIALFVALGGTGIAASRYIITSASQIKPSVRAHLRGAHGAEGIQGKLGEQGLRGLGGPAGPSGQDGARGPFGPTGLQGYKGVEGHQGGRGVKGCGQAPNRTWEVSGSYVQAVDGNCSDETGYHNWSYVVDPHDGKEYICVKGSFPDGDNGIYCPKEHKSPSEQVAEEEATKGVVKSEWRLKP